MSSIRLTQAYSRHSLLIMFIVTIHLGHLRVFATLFHDICSWLISGLVYVAGLGLVLYLYPHYVSFSTYSKLIL